MYLSAVSSLPSRERGLKSPVFCYNISVFLSLPSRERGLKYHRICQLDGSGRSLPSRERGLKFAMTELIVAVPRRSPRGSVD